MKKKIIIAFAITTLLFSCDNKSIKDEITDFLEEIKVVNNGVRGTYSKVENGKTQSNNSLGDLVGGFISKITFTGDSHCSVVTMGIPINGSYEIDGDYLYIDLGESPISFKIIDNTTLVGEGLVAGTFKKEVENNISKEERAAAEKEAAEIVDELFKEFDE